MQTLLLILCQVLSYEKYSIKEQYIINIVFV